MGAKRPPSGKRVADDQPPGLGDLIADILGEPKPATPSTVSRPARARRAGPFKVPASLAGQGNPQRDELARRFKQHLRGVSGANKLGADPDEYVPPSRPATQRGARPSFGFRPGPSQFGRPSPMAPDDDEDE